MSYQVLYRTYRPAKFSEVVGQDYIIKTLLNAIKNNRIAHAYLFAGPRGTGKTSVAKLFAKAINCEKFNGETCDECNSCKAYLSGNHPDIIEMDAASNNGIDEIRSIIEQVPYAPLIGKYKVYIIDEVHMMTTPAFNALLKILEEPPAHVIFILATTDPQKIIPTVLSRCQRYNFSKINVYDIKKKVIEILNKEGIPFEEKAINEIARMAEGGLRDALSLLEQCLAYNPKEIKLEDVEAIYGLTSTSREVELYKMINNKEINEVISDLRKIYAQGADLKKLATDLIEIAKGALLYSNNANASLLNKLSTIEAQDILSNRSVENLLNDIDYLYSCISKEKQNQNFLAYLELCLIKMTNISTNKQVKQEVKEIKQETKPVVEEVKQEAVEEVKEEIKEEYNNELIDIDLNFLFKILLDASRDLKINDMIIYNKLSLYMYEPDKRKYYNLLINTDLFASNKDAIIVTCSKVKADAINEKQANIDLYKFVNEEFGIDKMIYAIDDEQKKQLIDWYKKEPAENRNKPVYVEKYQLENKKQESAQEKLSSLFGDKVRIEE